MRAIVALLAFVFTGGTCLAWSEGGHHLIAVMAFDELTAEQQNAVLDILKSHPRFAEDFKTPDKAGDVEHWLIGRSAYWPDVARQQPKYNRSSWHYQLGPALVMDGVKAPANPGPVPIDATLETQELHIAQAIELCRRILRDKSKPAADRAIALCWIGHLVGDAHQPCHSGSLYCALFPEGDRGANSIPTKQSRNMHSLWDGLLGPRFDEGDIKRRAIETKANSELWAGAKRTANAEDNLNPMKWLAESAEFARINVYTPEVLTPIKNAEPGTKLEPIDLPEDYLKAAGRLAQKRAAFAAQRLWEILEDDVGGRQK